MPGEAVVGNGCPKHHQGGIQDLTHCRVRNLTSGDRDVADTWGWKQFSWFNFIVLEP